MTGCCRAPAFLAAGVGAGFSCRTTIAPAVCQWCCLMLMLVLCLIAHVEKSSFHFATGYFTLPVAYFHECSDSVFPMTRIDFVPV
jgi:hypothetical protein